MNQPTKTAPANDAGLAQRGLILLGGMTVLVAIVLLVALRRPDAPAKLPPTLDLAVPPVAFPPAGYPAAAPLAELFQFARRLPSAPGWEIRYNAALALARRGSAQTPWPLIAEMLDIDQLRRNFRTVSAKGQVVVDEAAAQRTIYNTLTALGQWHEKQDRAAPPAASAELQRVYQRVDRLAREAEPAVRVQAERVRAAFFR